MDDREDSEDQNSNTNIHNSPAFLEVQASAPTLGCEVAFLEAQASAPTLLNTMVENNMEEIGCPSTFQSTPEVEHEWFENDIDFAKFILCSDLDEVLDLGCVGFVGAQASVDLRPLDSFPSIGAQATLLEKNLADSGGNLAAVEGKKGKKKIGEENERKRKLSSGNVEDVNFDGSDLNYHSDEFMENNKLEVSDEISIGGGERKGKKNVLPSNRLRAEWRRRQTFEDGVSKLRSLVPKSRYLSKASIVGEAVEYVNKLRQRINDLQNPGSSLLGPNGQAAKVEVGVREGRAVNIHMSCGQKPGILLSTTRALDNLGLDIQEAVISCFDGFHMNIFRAEQSKEGQDLQPEQIRAILSETAGIHGVK